MAVHLRAITSGGQGITTDNYIVNEVPSGAINSINTIFTLAHSPENGTVSVYLNGTLQLPGSGNDYTISGGTINFNKAPHTNSEVLVTYIKY